MTKAAKDVRIGISGWTYAPWRKGAFFPEGWPQKRELEYASRQVSSIEINGSFYSLQRPESYRAWHEAAPEGFVFSVKGSRYITHLKRLKDIDKPLANFFASGVLLLREKLGPFLWQFPHNFVYRKELLQAFFAKLPRDTRAAAKLARGHDERLDGRSHTRTDRNRPLRHAIEIRHDSFKNADFVELLREHDIGLVVADTAGKWPFMEDVTSDFVYVRLHGGEELYVSGYSDAELKEWERKVRAWTAGRTPAKARLFGPRPKQPSAGCAVYVYFDNDVKVRAPFDAMTLAHRLGIGAAPAEAPDVATIAEEPRRGWPAIKTRWREMG
jgi:uncharacterized protein YecE (DUF72 family)